MHNYASSTRHWLGGGKRVVIGENNHEHVILSFKRSTCKGIPRTNGITPVSFATVNDAGLNQYDFDPPTGIEESKPCTNKKASAEAQLQVRPTRS